MLVLGRKIGESVMVFVNDLQLEVKVIQSGGVVKLGFSGPKDFEIIRGEILDDENRESCGVLID